PAWSFASEQLEAEGAARAQVGERITDFVDGTGRFTVRLLSSEGVLPGLPTPLTALLEAEGSQDRVDFGLSATGDTLDVTADGAVDLSDVVSVVSGTARLASGDIAPFSDLARRDLRGAVEASAEGSVALDLSQFSVTAEASTDDLEIGQPDLDALLAGSGRAELTARRQGALIEVTELDVETGVLALEASGSAGRAENDIVFDARLADVGRWVPAFRGAARVSGAASQVAGEDWRVELDAAAPGGATALLNGTASEDLASLDIAATGAVPLQAANGLIAPQAVSGMARFDLRLNGGPSLDSVSGRIESQGARLAAPALGVTITDVTGGVALAGAEGRLDLGGQVRGGGGVRVAGPIGLSAPFATDLLITLDRAQLQDPGLYRTTVSGSVGIDGGLTSGAQINGALALGQTEVRIPSGGETGTAPNVDVEHINTPPDVRRTRIRAGLVASPDAERGPSPDFPLALRIDAPNRIFLRGRGLEAELGGQLRLGGTTANVVPTGQFELIRGRLDILGQRFQFDEGTATLQGDFNPFIRLVATTDQGETTIRVVVEGLAASPDILFQSEPELPEDEVLARLLFDRGVDNLSPLQAAQLANAVATLAGRGGDGIVGRLRQNFGLDDLDVTSDSEGGTAVRAGRYISDNVYSDVTVDSAGGAEVSINLDLSRSVTVKGSVGSEGNTGIGVFFERDY
ncbi:MAG: translocation/assembly module TamB domain-containing protein, partial [Pseudomonadota bacterium]